MMKQYYMTLDSFRGLCACFVALSHFNAVSIFERTSILSQAAIYVDFFFVLSGFVIFSNYGDRLRSGYGIWKFMVLRFGRLYPLHFCVLMAFVGADLLQMVLPVGGLALYKPFSAPGESAGDIVANLFLVHSLNVSKNLAFNGPSWSISVEFYTYIVFALILALSGKHYRSVIFAMGMASAVALYFLTGELYAKLDYGFFRCIYGFAAGALIYELYSGTQSRFLPFIQKWKIVNLTEIVILAATVIYIAFFSQGPLSMAAPVVFSLVVFVFAFEGGIISRFLKFRPLVFLGTLSYSIYMIHMFISGKFFALPARLVESGLGFKIATLGEGGFPVFGANLLTGTLWEIFYLLVVIGFSFMSYKIIEEPCRNWTKKFVRGEMRWKGFKVPKPLNLET